MAAFWKSLWGKLNVDVTDVQITDTAFEDASIDSESVSVATPAAVELATMRQSLTQLEDESTSLRERLAIIEDQWSTKVGDYMQRNAQLRMDVKRADRELATAKTRVGVLEQALENAALGSDELQEDLKKSSTPVASLGEGHGGAPCTRNWVLSSMRLLSARCPANLPHRVRPPVA